MRRFNFDSVVQSGFWMCLILNALQAYSIFSIPIPWMGNALLVVLTLFFFVNSRFVLFPGALPFLFFSIWVVVDFLIILVVKGSIPESPTKATLAYYPYVSLRFFNIFVCGFAICLAYSIIRRGRKDQLINFMVNLGFAVGLYSLYVYYAQTHGLPEIPRTRMGTGGEAQATTFTYAFHRAMGTFREPSHLAEWMILPLFLSIYQSKKFLNYKAAVISLALLMTGSLTGIVGFLGGGGAALAVNMRFGWKSLAPPLKMVSLILGAGIVFAIFMATKAETQNVSLAGTLWERVEPLLHEKGLKNSNRDYVYYYLDRKPFTMVGDGVGNPNIEFSKYLESDATASFLSLYITTLYSAGYIGLFILGIFLIYPIFLFYRYRSRIKDPHFFYLMAAYLGWLIVFSIHSEELNFQFGVCYAVVVGALHMEFYEKKTSNTL